MRQTTTSVAATHYGITSSTSQQVNQPESKLKRASSLGVSGKSHQNDNSGTEAVNKTTSDQNHLNINNVNNTSTVSQSAAFTDFRLPPDSLTPSDTKRKQKEKDAMLPAISSTVKKANQKA